MARPVQAIEKDLRALGGQADALGEQFQQTYDSYLQQLGPILRRQLALAGYQVCTQKYPEAFLQLTLRQQQDLQEALRKLGKVAAERLQVDKLQAADAIENGKGEVADLADAADTDRDDTESDATARVDLPPSGALAADARELPAYWAEWVQQCEGAIAKVLQDATIATNQLLQKFDILPERLPVGALEIAARAKEPGTPNAANLSEIAIELRSAKEKDKDADGEVVAAAVVQLRLGDLELSDPTLQSQRRRLQELGRHFGALVKKYRRVTQEQAVARAELAWRTSWFDED